MTKILFRKINTYIRFHLNLQSVSNTIPCYFPCQLVRTGRENGFIISKSESPSIAIELFIQGVISLTCSKPSHITVATPLFDQFNWVGRARLEISITRGSFVGKSVIDSYPDGVLWVSDPSGLSPRCQKAILCATVKTINVKKLLHWKVIFKWNFFP